MSKIKQFRQQYGFLSNFSDYPVQLDGLTYLNGEAAFQAGKVTTHKERLTFVGIPPNIAKSKGRKVKLRSDWEAIKVDRMRQVIDAKFSDPKLAKLLDQTGDAELLEGNTWNDKFWGVDIITLQGQNQLGKILMAKREQLRANDSYWDHCFVCGEPSDGEASQWHGRPLCAEENGNRCLRDLENK